MRGRFRAAFAICGEIAMKTYVYIDGFNLYFGSVKKTPFKWLNISEMCRLMLPKHNIEAIKYYTALVKPLPHDPKQPMRQQTYLRALQTLPNVTVVYGHFLSHIVKMPLAYHKGKKLKYVDIIKTEEKGSDVNLATHLLDNAYQGDFDIAVIVSNDSDLVEPVKIVKDKLKKKVGILNPHKHPSQELLKHATFFKTIRKGVLKTSQFPEEMEDKRGKFHKPSSW